MNPEAYALAAQAEERHWWFSARRDILESVIDRYCPRAAERKVLEVGCGSGGNLGLLARYGQVYAVELSDEARDQAAGRGIGCVEKGWLPDGLPFGHTRFELIAALDVIEHVDDDRAAMRALRHRLATGGLLVATVPAFMWLWSAHDEFAHHKRRYSLPQIVGIMKDSGLRTVYASYFNSLLFPVAAAHIKLRSRFGGDPADAMRIPAAPVNALLRAIFRAERHLLPRFSLPFGLSVLVCARLG